MAVENKRLLWRSVLNRAVVLCSAALILYCVVFVITHQNIVLNRYVDSWWHISVADEYVRTGEFAKDPFFEQAPPFAQFGLMDVANAGIAAITGTRTETVFPYLVAANVLISLLAAFLSGYLLNGKVLDGLVALLAWLIVHGRHTIIGLGFPFATGIAMLMLFLVILWQTRWSRVTLGGAFFRAVFLGLIFAMHVFVGLVGVAAVTLSITSELVLRWRAKDGPGIRSLCGRAGIVVVGFLLIGWRWILLHISLRPVLAEINAHAGKPYGVERPFLIVLSAVFILLLLMVCGSEQRRWAWRFLLFSCLLLVLCIPTLNGALEACTSWYMARRIPLFAPVGVACALAVRCCCNAVRCGGIRQRVFAAGLVCVLGLLLVPALNTWARFHVWMWRTHDFDVHQYAFLRELPGDVSGKTLLTDPTTSYFARGMRGCYVRTVTPGVASPAVDHAVLDACAAGCLRGDACNATPDAVLLVRSANGTARFAGRTEQELIELWLARGKRVTYDGPHGVLLQARGE